MHNKTNVTHTAAPPNLIRMPGSINHVEPTALDTNDPELWIPDLSRLPDNPDRFLPPPDNPDRSLPLGELLPPEFREFLGEDKGFRPDKGAGI
jgi:hypothetical protein